ncbi:MAG: sigma 54-interacting transcriptional regulator [Ignavibacteria bacterium]|nr:sigma 54-interacting transcriptional regulator [Ignavibacteria bacterium]
MSDTPGKTVPTIHANTILDSIADGVFTVDTAMRITSFNRAAERITGVPRGSAVGQFCFEVLRANICERTCALKCSFETGEETIGKQVNILRGDGKQIPISISTAVLHDDSGAIVGGVESFRDLSALEELRKEIAGRYTFHDIVSKNHAMRKLFDILPYIAESESSVLIQGPSGSGKELFARAIHNLSPRAQGPFVAVNCGALPDALLESELFGYVQGAFTDARRDKPGRFALAEGGSLFLDEVDSLPRATQVKLLRVLQEREYTPLGASAAVRTSVRVIAASKEDVSKLVESGSFRDDLYFRLNVVKLLLPPLSDRRDDIPLLVARFVEKLNLKMDRDIAGVSEEVLELFMRYPFPGNVRELENVLEHAFIMCRGGLISLAHLPGEMTMRVEAPHPLSSSPLDALERQALVDALIRHKGVKIHVAKALGIHRSSLWRMMKKHGLL